MIAWLLTLTIAAQTPARAVIVSAARDVVEKAHYCTFITLGADGHPQARVVDPLPPDESFSIWFATNPLTRKVAEIKKDARVTLSCFDASTSSFVTVLGRAALVADPDEKARHWKSDWARIYPNGARGDDVVLVHMTPTRLEIVSESRGIRSDPKTWAPTAIAFPER